MESDSLANPAENSGDMPDWHAVAPDEATKQLKVDPRYGLTGEEAARRIERFGPNQLPEEEGPSALARFLSQFRNVLIYILLAAAVFTAMLGEWIDTGVIALVVLVNAVVGFIQEGKAAEAMEGIRRLLSLEADVVRDGERRRIPAEELVPGDIVRLESGDRVPADLRILSARNVRAEEAALTGESEPVSKSPKPVDAGASVGDRRSMAYSGTLLTSGRVTGVVTATGTATEIGRIGELVSRVKEVRTPLLRRIDHFGHQLSIAIVGGAALVFLLGWLVRGLAVTDAFLAVVALAVAAIPEGLPAILTITLALGVQRMAGRNAIIRRLPAVETLGSVTVICTDKTGTLTRNEMSVERILLAEDLWTVTGSGYIPAGEFRLGDEVREPASRPDLMQTIRAGLLCNEAEFSRASETDRKERVLRGDPTEGALLILAEKAGLDRHEEEAEWERLDLLPFESERRWMASKHRSPGGEQTVFLKGAPEQILAMCSGVRSGDEVVPLDIDRWSERMEAVAGEGYRLLACAELSASGIEGELTEDALSTDSTLLGVVALMDPPRPEAIESVEKCRSAGIRVVMITGDHAATARSIGARMGIGTGDEALTGAELEALSDEELRQVAREHDVIARASPEHKLRFVRALQAEGEVCAMTGDGVNDAPALKRADIGVAMGIKGSEAAKGASEMVLADDNFASIERAVEEGRTIYDNIKKTILFILPTNGAEALIVLASVLLMAGELPITPAQILWVNMITAVTLALALAFEPSEAGIMKRPPRDPKEPILSPFLLRRIIYVSILVSAGCLALFEWEISRGTELAVARTVVINALVAAQLWYLFTCRFQWRPSIGWQALVGNRAVLIAAGVLVLFQGAFTYLPLFHLLFGTAPLPAPSWIGVFAVGLGLYLVVEAEKAIGRRRLARQSSEAA